MQIIPLSLTPEQDLVDLADVIDRISQDHLPGIDSASRSAALSRLVNNLLFIKASKSPNDVSEWARLTEEYYAEADAQIAEGVSFYDAEWAEHMRTSHELGLSHRAA